MKILVLLRTVVDASEDVPLVDGQLVENSLVLAPNEFDEYALEEALRLKTEAGATVVAAAPESAGNRILHAALARGADRAIRIDGASPVVGCSVAGSHGLAALARELQADLVLVGVQAPDDIFGQIAPLTGARLGWPQVSGVASIEVGDGGVTVVQELEGGRSVTLAVSGPAVLGVQASRQAPRYVSATKLKQVMQSATIEAKTFGAADPGAASLLAIERPPSMSRVEMLSENAEEVAAALAAILAAQTI